MMMVHAMNPCLTQGSTHQNYSEWQVMNEVALHRGSSSHLNTIDIYVDGQHLTEAVVSTTN